MKQTQDISYNIFKEKSTKVFKGTRMKFCGMYVGAKNRPDMKGNFNILETYPETGNYYTSKTKFYKRNYGNHKIGEPKLIPERKFKYNNILEAWEAAKDYPSVSYGMTCWRREVIVVDDDSYFDSKEEVVKKYDKFKPTYLSRNKKSRHAQIGWVLLTPFVKSPRRNELNYHQILIKAFAKALKSDTCFNGPACKNPYYKDFESVIYDGSEDQFQDRVYLTVADVLKVVDEGLKINSPSSSIYEYIKEEEKNAACIFSKARDSQSEGLKQTNSSSANVESHIFFYMSSLRSKIFKYFRETHKELTDEKLIVQYQNEVIADMEKAGYIFNNMAQTVDATKKIVKWCNEKGLPQHLAFLDKHSFTHARWCVEARIKSARVRQAKKDKKMLLFKDWMDKNQWRLTAKRNKYSKVRAAKEIGITIDEFRQYFKEYGNKNQMEALEFVRYAA